MRTLYFDCSMGAAGDMLSAALLELLPEPDSMVARLNALGLPGVEYIRENAVKCGIRGTHMAVLANGEEELEHHHEHEHHYHHDHEHGEHHEHDHDGHHHDHGHEDHHDHHGEHHHHSGMHDVEHIVSHLSVSDRVKSDILAVYGLIAQAESKVHGVPVPEIHFHEVGTLDAIADVTAVCLLMEELAPEQVIASAVHVGSGQVQCAHGLLSVPTPATAELLRGIPAYGGEIRGELCTPTGAALLRHFVTEFGPMPAMRTEAIGYGMGKKDFPAANCVRALLGDTREQTDLVVELSCNLDDMGAEDIGFAMEQLLAAGALDVYTLPIGMKKNRPGTMLRVMCAAADREKMAELIFRHTTTLGIREEEIRRRTLERRVETVETDLGPVRVKRATGYGASRQKIEYEDLARLAREQELSLAEVRRRLGEL